MLGKRRRLFEIPRSKTGVCLRRAFRLGCESLEARNLLTAVGPGDYSGNFAADTEFLDATGTYRIISDGLINPGVTVTVGPGVNVEILNNVNWSVGGNLVFNDAASVRLFDNGGGTTLTSIEVQSGGLLQADSTPFSLVNFSTNDLTQIEVGSGGRLIANDSDFGIDRLLWDSGATINAGDVVDNAFNSIVQTPAEFIPQLENNDSFNLVELTGSPVSSNLTMRQMGNVNTTNLVYRFIGDIPIDPGATLKFDPGTTVEVGNNVNLNVSGTLWFDNAASVGFFDNGGGTTLTSIEVKSGGLLQADSTPFSLLSASTNDLTHIEVETGGRILAGDSDFAIDRVLWESSSTLNAGDVINNVFDTILQAPVEYIPLLENNDSFNLVELIGAPVTANTTLRQMGTVSTSDLVYRFISDIPINPGATLKFEPNTVVEIGNNVNITVTGILWFDDSASVGFFDTGGGTTLTSIEIQSGGLLQANSTPIGILGAQSSDLSQIEIETGGRLLADDCDLAVDRVLWESGAILNPGDVVNNVFNSIVQTPAEFIPSLENNDSFDLVELTGSPVVSNLTMRQMGTINTTNLVYRFIGDIPINPGATLKFDPGTTVEIGNNVNLNVSGTLWFDNAASVGFFDSGSGTTLTSIEVKSGGLLQSDSTPFMLLSASTNDLTHIEVETGGRILADDSDFAIDRVLWETGSTLNAGDVINNVFDAILQTPVEFIPLVENNDSFNTVELNGAPVSTDLTLRQMGTVNTTDLVYRFIDDISIEPGTTLKFDPGTTVEVGNNVNINVSGTLWFDDAVSVGFFDTGSGTTLTSIEILSGGLLQASSTPFVLMTISNGDTSQIEVETGGRLQAIDSDFAIDKVLWNSGSTLSAGDVVNNVFDTTIQAAVEFVPLLENNDSFKLVELTGAPVNSNVTLRQMGAVNTTDLVYRFISDIPVNPGAALKFAPGTTVEVANDVNINVSGDLWFDDTANVSFFDNGSGTTLTSIEVLSGGLFRADSTPFAIVNSSIGDISRIAIEQGGSALLRASNLQLDELILAPASIAEFSKTRVANTLSIAGTTILDAEDNDFASATIDAVGTANHTIDLENNWWGSSDPVDIENKINHQIDDANLPLVQFAPFLSAPPPECATIHGFKFEDLDGDGVQDEGEGGLAGVVIYLDLNNDGVLGADEPRTTTIADDPLTSFNETGLFRFDDVAPGTYVMREVDRPGFFTDFSICGPSTSLILFDNTGDELGITVPGASEFSVGGATFDGGVIFSATMLELFASSNTAYDASSGSAVVTFDFPVDLTTFFFVHNSSFAAGSVTALGVDGQVLAQANSNLATTGGDPANFITLDPAAPIASLTFSGGVIDNFEFTTSTGEQSHLLHLQPSASALDRDFGNQPVADSAPPTVTEVIVSSPTWSPQFIDTIDGGGIGAGNSIGFSVTASSPTLPWDDISQIQVQFSEDVAFAFNSNFELRDSGGVIPLTTSYDSDTFRVTIDLAQPLPFSKYRLGISDVLMDGFGNQLDGDQNGTPGGIFDLRFDVVPGDANADGRVNGSDLAVFSAAFLTQAGSANYEPRADWNADTRVNGSDLATFTTNFLANIGTQAEPAAPFSGGSGGGGGESASFDSNDDFVDQFFLGFGDDEDEENLGL